MLFYGASQPAVEHTLPTREAQASVIHQFVQEGLKQNPKTTFVLTVILMTTISQPRRRSLLATN